MIVQGYLLSYVTKAALVIGMKPEEEARKKIDALLESAGWIVQSFEDLNLSAGLGVAVREFPLKSGFAD